MPRLYEQWKRRNGDAARGRRSGTPGIFLDGEPRNRDAWWVAPEGTSWVRREQAIMVFIVVLMFSPLLLSSVVVANVPVLTVVAGVVAGALLGTRTATGVVMVAVALFLLPFHAIFFPLALVAGFGAVQAARWRSPGGRLR
jgi:hypothetical protein